MDYIEKVKIASYSSQKIELITQRENLIVCYFNIFQSGISGIFNNIHNDFNSKNHFKLLIETPTFKAVNGFSKIGHQYYYHVDK